MYPYDYNDYETNTGRREPRARLGLGTILLVLVLGLAAGLLGGVIYNQFVAVRTQPNATVVLQTAPDSGPAATQVNPSIAEYVAGIAADSVVEITTESKVTHPFFGSYVTSGAGSGVILSADGYIVTNYHVIDGTSAISVRLGSGETLDAVMVGSDKQTDLAVLKVRAEHLTTAVIADSDQVRVGQPAIAIGNPLGTLGGTVTEGIISAKDREISIDQEAMVLLQTSAAINPGNSGGGLFNENGQLIGVVNAKSSGSDIEGLGFAIPSNTMTAVVSQLIENGYVTGRPSLGITVVSVNSMEGLYRYRVSDYGIYVSHAVYDNGLRQGDRIVSVADQAITGTADIKDVLRGYQVGDEVEIVVNRSGRNRTIAVVLRESGPTDTAGAM